MKGINFLVVVLLFSFSVTSLNLTANCSRCDEIRRNNANNKGKEYHYYEEYLEDHNSEHEREGKGAEREEGVQVDEAAQ